MWCLFVVLRLELHRWCEEKEDHKWRHDARLEDEGESPRKVESAHQPSVAVADGEAERQKCVVYREPEPGLPIWREIVDEHRRD